MHQHEKINYVEFPARDLNKAKEFFTAVFNWSFTDYGPEYTAFENEGLDGGFFKSENVVSASSGSALIVFFSDSLEQTEAKVNRTAVRFAKLFLISLEVDVFILLIRTVMSMRFGLINKIHVALHKFSLCF